MKFLERFRVPKESEKAPKNVPEEPERKEAAKSWSARRILDGKVSIEEARRAEFEGYQEDFNLSPEELQKPILDVGAHDGLFVQYVRNVLGNTATYGVDKSDFGIIPNNSEGMVLANGVQLPFRDGQFDIVLARNYLPLFSNTGYAPFAVWELLRVVKPGGYVKFNSTTPDKELQAKEEWAMRSGTGQRNTSADAFFDKRYVETKKLEAFLQKIKERGYLVTEEKGARDRLVVTVHRPQ